MKKEKTKKRAIEDILEDILRQLKFNHSQPIYPQEPHPYIQPINFHNPALHYMDNLVIKVPVYGVQHYEQPQKN